MKTRHIGRIVTGCLVGGLVVALALVLGPVAGAQEHVITGTVLLAFAASWALLATLSMRWTDQPQRWAFAPAAFMGLAGAALLVFAPNGEVVDALGWVWPPLFLALLAGTIVRVHRDLHSRSRVVGRVPAARCLRALCSGRGLRNGSRGARPPHVAPGQLVDVGGHRLHLRCAGSGTPTVLLESGLGETGAYWGWISPAVASDTRVCVYDRAGRGWSDPVSAAAGRRRCGHGSPHPAGPRARSRSVRARRPFVRRAVRQDLRRPVSRTGGRHGPPRRPACGSVRGPAVVSNVLPRLPSHLRGVADAGSARRRTSRRSSRPRVASRPRRDDAACSPRVSRASIAACEMSSRNCHTSLCPGPIALLQTAVEVDRPSVTLCMRCAPTCLWQVVVTQR